MLAATSRPTTSHLTTSHSTTSLVTVRSVTAVVALMFAALLVGCRGSKPFGRFVQVTQDPDSEVIDVEAPRQRLATAKPRTEPAVTVATENERLPTSRRISAGMEQVRTGQTADAQIARVSGDEPAADARSATASQVSTKPSMKPRSTREQALAKRTVLTPKTPAPQSASAASPKPERSLGDQLALNESDHAELMAAFSDYPPEVQREALRRLVAATAKSAQKTSQPGSLESALVRNLDHLPELPAASEEPSDRMPYRLADINDARNTRSQSESQVVAPEPARSPAPKRRDVAVSESASISFSDQPVDVQVPQTSRPTEVVVAASSPTPKSVPNRKTVETPKPSADTVALAGEDDLPVVSQASLTRREVGGPSVLERVTPASATSDEPMPAIAIDSLGNEDLYKALVASLSKAPAGETESDRASRLIKLRHLMVLSGNVDGAVEQIEGMSESEQEFLRHQLLGLWTMVDPNGHPMPSRRITTALPQLRAATKFAAAATDSLDVRALSFCTEIESYGQIKPFEGNRFSAGQQVILYCEIENFIVNKVDGGFETHLQGSYDVYNDKNEKVVSQLLPADRQVSANHLRDYFIAYQMHLPGQLTPGTYRLQLTMEDVSGKKYGQSSIPFQIAK